MGCQTIGGVRLVADCVLSGRDAGDWHQDYRQTLD
jgi:hypothetical protein